MLEQTLVTEVFRPFARVLALLSPGQLRDVIANTKFVGITRDEGLIARKLKEVWQRDGNLEFTSEIIGKIRESQRKYGAIPHEISTLIGEVENAVVRLQFSSTSSALPYVFVLLPFRDEFFTVFDEAIKPVFETLGCKVAHADDPKLTGKVDHRIIEFVVTQISNASILIADTTGHNPNVFYELGYAHAKGKTVIILTQDDVTPPFNIRDWLHIHYKADALAALRTKLKSYGEPIVEDFKQGKR